MCSICNQFECPDGYPNQSLRRAHGCSACREDIYEGEEYYRIGKSYFHKECLLECYGKDELLLLLGAVPHRAKGSAVACVFMGVYNAEQDKED